MGGHLPSNILFGTKYSSNYVKATFLFDHPMRNIHFQPQTVQERNYQGENPLRTFAYLYSNQKGRLLLAVLLYFIKASPVWAMPLVTAHIIDLVATGGPKTLENLWLTALILAVMLIQNIPMHYLYVRQISQAVRTMSTQLRSAIVHRLQQLSIDYYKSQSAGRLQNKVLRDVESIETLTRTVYDGGLGAFFAIIIAIITTAIRAPAFLLIFLVTVPVAAAVLRGLRSAMAERNASFRVELERMSARVIEMTHLIPITRAHGLEQDEIERVDATLSDVKHSLVRWRLLGHLQPVQYRLPGFHSLVLLHSFHSHQHWRHRTPNRLLQLADQLGLATNEHGARYRPGFRIHPFDWRGAAISGLGT